MAKLIKQAFWQKTHDEGDSAMRERGAAGIFYNAAFQETSEATAKEAMRKKRDAPSPSSNDSASTSEPTAPASPKVAQSADVWASPPATPSMVSTAIVRSSQQGMTNWAQPSPTGGKRAASTSACPTPKAHRLSMLMLPKNVTEVEEIAARDLNLKDDPANAEDEEAEEINGARVELPVEAAPRMLVSPPTRSNIANNTVRLWEEEVKRLLLAGRVEDALRWVAPSEGLVRCTMRRVKNFMGQTQAYRLFLDNGDTFLLAARKRKRSTHSNYVLSTSQNDLGRDSEHRIAKLRANFIGTEYSLVSRVCVDGADGAASKQMCAGSGGWSANSGAASRSAVVQPASPTSGSSRQQQHHRDLVWQEDMAIHYKQTGLTGKAGPRVMLVATPLPDVHWAPLAQNGSAETLTRYLDAARRRELPPRIERQLCMLATRPPEWDPTLKAYTLDFSGRVRASSVKNFQLVHWDHNTDRKGADLVLQFGKVDEGTEDFALDFTYPMTLEKAFGIALASTDSKICYTI